jgi:hypothetical protein
MKRLALIAPLFLLLLAVPMTAAADSGHADLKGCQAEGATYWVDVGPPGGVPFGPCCVRGYYDGPAPGVENGFPGGCCKNNEQHNQAPGAPDNPGQGVWQTVGWQCECPGIRGF